MKTQNLFPLLLLASCGGGGDEGGALFEVRNVGVTASVVDQVVVTGEIELLGEGGIGGTSGAATFIDDGTGGTIATATGLIGSGLSEVGDVEAFELTSIQARLLPDDDGFLRVCVDLQIDQTGYELAQRIGCVDGEEPYVTPTTGSTTYVPPEEPPVVIITEPFDQELFGIGETVDLAGECSDINQSDGSLLAEWTYTEQPKGSPVPIYTEPIGNDGNTTGSWYNPPLGDYLVTLTCTDDASNSTSDSRLISVVDRQLTDLDGDGFTPYEGDCNDNDDTRYPGAEELCDSVDQDCDTEIDNRDLDGDQHIDEACTAYTGVLPVDDCDDNDPGVHPLIPEVPNNGTDEDCDGFDY